jgi:3-hydroxyacyl-CoA dehydrogenase
MGAGIAAHLTNAGIPTVLLDIVPPNLTDEEKQIKELRNKFALNGIEVAKKFKPAPLFFHGRLASLITPRSAFPWAIWKTWISSPRRTSWSP